MLHEFIFHFWKQGGSWKKDGEHLVHFFAFSSPPKKAGQRAWKRFKRKKTTKAVSAFFLLTILMRMQQNEKKNKFLPIIVYLLIQGRLELYGRMPTLKGFWLDYYEGDTFYEYWDEGLWFSKETGLFRKNMVFKARKTG